MSISDGEAHQRPPNGSTNAPPLSSATAGNSGKPPIFNVPNHPTIHPASSCHSVTAPDLSKPPHRPEAHPRSQVWTHRPLHKSGQQQRPHHQTRRGTYLGMRANARQGICGEKTEWISMKLWGQYIRCLCLCNHYHM